MKDLAVKNDLSLVKKNLEAYFETHDVKYVSNDAIFINMGTGDKYIGREAIKQMLETTFHGPLEAKVDITNTIITEQKAVLEGIYKGKQMAEFAGIAPHNNSFNVPLCVVYKLENALIKEAKIYMLGEVLMRQLQHN